MKIDIKELKFEDRIEYKIDKLWIDLTGMGISIMSLLGLVCTLIVFFYYLKESLFWTLYSSAFMIFFLINLFLGWIINSFQNKKLNEKYFKIVKK